MGGFRFADQLRRAEHLRFDRPGAAEDEVKRRARGEGSAGAEGRAAQPSPPGGNADVRGDRAIGAQLGQQRRGIHRRGFALEVLSHSAVDRVLVGWGNYHPYAGSRIKYRDSVCRARWISTPAWWPWC